LPDVEFGTYFYNTTTEANVESQDTKTMRYLFVEDLINGCWPSYIVLD